MRRRRPFTLRCLGALALLMALGCAGQPRVPPPQPLREEVRRFLLNPTGGYPPGGDRVQIQTVEGAFTRLVERGEIEAAASTANKLLAAAPTFRPAALLLAMTELARGRAGEAAERLGPICAEQPTWATCQLTLGRSLELIGDLPGAYVAYQRARNVAAVAAERSEQLGPQAAEAVSARLVAALRAGRLDEAASLLTWLEAWLPASRATVEGQRALARARGDQVAELAAVRSLVAGNPNDRELVERQGDLELAVGDPGKGLEIFERLARANPRDGVAAENLARARFEWRLSMLPERVQQAARRAQPTRADLAVLFYWLIPGLRAGRPAATGIASDVFDHPAREEIVRVVNFGLVRIDETLHQYEPRRLVGRGESDIALARVLLLFGSGQACVRSASRGGAELTREAACSLLDQCGVSGAAGSCLAASGSPSGRELLDRLRRAIELLGRN